VGRRRSTVRADLRAVSYVKWLEFVFGRSATPSGKTEWYLSRDLDVVVDPLIQLRYMVRLVSAPGALLRKFSPGQIEDGFWFMFGPGGQRWFIDLIWNPSLPWSLRRKFLVGLPRVYASLFRRANVATADFMLWDLFAEAKPTRPRNRRDALRVVGASRLALRRMLESRHEKTMHAALHGLGHLGDRASIQVVERFIRRPGRRGQSLRGYAREVIEGRSG